MFDVREYRRLSKDRRGTSIKRQGEQNGFAQVKREWTAGAPYSDGDRSASPYGQREREDFERLMADLRSGNFGARYLQAYETSRLSRTAEEGIQLLKVCRSADVLIYITDRDRIYDPNNGNDRKDFRDSISSDEHSSDQTSKRTGDTAALEAHIGRPSGRAPYGYKALYDQVTGDLITWIPDEMPAGCVRVESRAQVIGELFERLELGHSLRRIQKYFTACGYLNKSGMPFSDKHLRNMALRHAYAGIRIHKGQEHPAIWDGLVAEERFRKVQRLLSDPARRQTRNGRAVHEFTGVIICGKCGLTKMRVRRESHRFVSAIYKCHDSCVSMLKSDVDEILTAKLIEYLSREDVYNALTARMGDDADVLKVRTALAVARADKQEMDKEVPKTLAETRVLARAIDGLETDISALEAQERALTLPPALASLLGARGSIREAWFKAPIEACREIVRHVMVPDLLGQPIITGVSIGQRYTPPGERLQWEVE